MSEKMGYYVSSKLFHAMTHHNDDTARREGTEIIEKFQDRTESENKRLVDEWCAKYLNSSYKNRDNDTSSDDSDVSNEKTNSQLENKKELSKSITDQAVELGIDPHEDYVSQIDSNPDLKSLRNSPLRDRLTNEDIIMFQVANKGGIIDRETIMSHPIVAELEENLEKQEVWITEAQAKGEEPIDRYTKMYLTRVYNQYISNALSKSKAPKEGKAVIVIGPPASGKSSAIEKGLGITPDTHFTLDSDDIKKSFKSRFDNGKGSPVVHEASSMLHKQAFDEAIKSKINLAIPIVGSKKEKIDKYAQKLKDAGYDDVEIVLADLPIEKSATRNFARMMWSGRHIPFKYMYDNVGNNPQKVYNEIKGEIDNGTSNITNYRRISTDVAFGDEPISVESSKKKRNS